MRYWILRWILLVELVQLPTKWYPFHTHLPQIENESFFGLQSILILFSKILRSFFVTVNTSVLAFSFIMLLKSAASGLMASFSKGGRVVQTIAGPQARMALSTTTQQQASSSWGASSALPNRRAYSSTTAVKAGEMDSMETGTKKYMSLYPEGSTDGSLRLGNIVPDFSCSTTLGDWESFHEWKKGE
jgi:hypothetical protein